MSEPTLLAIDAGTTSTRAILFAADGRVLDVQQAEIALILPLDGWVEQDAADIVEKTLRCARRVMEAAEQKPLILGITNQRETTILWDRKTGRPISNAIVWQDRRTAAYCQTLREQGHEDFITRRTGLLLDPYFSATKIAWLLDHVPGARARAVAGEIAFGTVDCWLLWHLTGGRVHATDATNAARTMLYNIVQHKWDADLLALFDIPAGILPEVRDTAADYGLTDAAVTGFVLPVGALAGDQQAALIGQGCFTPGMVKATYGTGCFALMNIGPEFKLSHNRLLTTVAYQFSGRTTYALEGSIFVAGAAVQWLRDGLGLIGNAAETEDLARGAPDAPEGQEISRVYFVPAFTGLGAPFWRPEARGLIIGLGRDTTRAHIAKAALEAQGFQTRDLMEALIADSGIHPAVLRADGGLMRNRFVAQFLADMLGLPVELPRAVEATAWGAAAAAGLQAGVFKEMADIAALWRCEKRFDPTMDHKKRGELYEGWRRAVSLLAPS